MTIKLNLFECNNTALLECHILLHEWNRVYSEKRWVTEKEKGRGKSEYEKKKRQTSIYAFVVFTFCCGKNNNKKKIRHYLFGSDGNFSLIPCICMYLVCWAARQNTEHQQNKNIGVKIKKKTEEPHRCWI